MRPTVEGNGKLNEKYSGTPGSSEEKERGNNPPLGFCTETVGSGRRSSRMLTPRHSFPLISGKVTVGSIVCSDTWQAYAGLAAKGFVHRLANHGEREYSDGRENHINELEGFWGYLKRKLAAEGRIRRDESCLYLGEYVWRNNHR